MVRKGAFLTSSVLLVSLLVALLPLSLRAPEKARAGGARGWYVQYQDDEVSVFAVSAVDERTCWAVGRTTGDAPRALALRTTDGGESWTPSYPEFPTILTCASAISDEVCWAGGYGCILKTENGGSSWEVKIAADGYYVTGISAVDERTCWAVGYSTTSGTSFNGFIVKTGDGGASWEAQASGIPCPMTDVSAVDERTCWASGGFFSPGMVWPPVPAAVAGRLMKTVDGGSNWQEYGEDGYAYYKLSAPDSLNLWVASLRADLSAPLESRTEIRRSPDGGESWIVHPTSLGPWNYSSGSIEAIDGETAWLAAYPLHGFNGIYRSDDGGASWTAQAEAPATLTDISAAGALAAWASGCDPTNLGQYGHGYVMHTANGGWERAPHIEALSPSSGMAGDTATIAGSDFGERQPFCAVRFGELSAPVVSWSEEEIVCVVPDGVAPGPLEVTVVTGGGVSNPATFCVEETTVIEGTVAHAGYVTHSEGIRVSLFDLEGDLLETAFTDENGEYRLESESAIYRCKVEFFDPGDVYRTEWHADKPDFASADVVYPKPGNRIKLDAWLDLWPPEIAAVEPSRALIKETTDIALTGSHFSDSCIVELWGDHRSVPIDDYTIVSPTRIEFRLDLSDFPKYDAGLYDVVVTNTYDWQRCVLEGGMELYTPEPLTLFSIAPECAFNRGLVEADIFCAGFREGLSVRLENDSSSLPVSAWPDGDDRVHCLLDLVEAPPGTYDVVLANPGGEEARLPAGFTVLENPVRVDAVEPREGRQGTTVTVGIHGSGFQPGMKASLREATSGYALDAASTTVDSAQHMTCSFELYDAWEGVYHVVVTDTGGNVSLLAGGFSVTPNPSPLYLLSVAPNQVTQFAGFVAVELRGNGFKPGAAVKLRKGDKQMDGLGVGVPSPDLLRCTFLVFGAEPGSYDVVVINPDGVGARMREAFQVSPACGQGSGAAALLLGALMGLLSAARVARSRRGLMR